MDIRVHTQIKLIKFHNHPYNSTRMCKGQQLICRDSGSSMQWCWAASQYRGRLRRLRLS